jgi:PAS domain S-box-containing protein
VERPAAQLLQQSSDAVVVIRLEDGLIVDVHEALFAITGHRAEDLIGRNSQELLIWSTLAGRSEPAAGLRELTSSGEEPAGFRTQAGELRVGNLSALVVDVEDGRHALCTLRASRDPTAAERRGIAQLELWRILRSGGAWLEMARAAVRVLAECLRWELGTAWEVDRAAGVLRCIHVWCAPVGCPEALAEASARMAVRAGEGVAGRVWETGEAAWIPDVLAHPDVGPARPGAARAPVHGWVAVPVPGDGQVLGVLELVSRAIRHRDEETLHLLQWLGSHLGTVAMGGVPDDQGGETVPGLELQWNPPPVLRELARSVRRLNRLLEDFVEADRPERTPRPGEAPAGGGEGGLTAGLTLKAVSERTGIPAATVRTWERRYRFIHPSRSSSGYRIYGEEDIARILEVKRLLDQGVRISEAMAVVRGRAPEDEGV